jgi:hypothetical protein
MILCWVALGGAQCRAGGQFCHLLRLGGLTWEDMGPGKGSSGQGVSGPIPVERSFLERRLKSHDPGESTSWPCPGHSKSGDHESLSGEVLAGLRWRLGLGGVWTDTVVLRSGYCSHHSWHQVSLHHSMSICYTPGSRDIRVHRHNGLCPQAVFRVLVPGRKKPR